MLFVLGLVGCWWFLDVLFLDILFFFGIFGFSFLIFNLWLCGFFFIFVRLVVVMVFLWSCWSNCWVIFFCFEFGGNLLMYVLMVFMISLLYILEIILIFGRFNGCLGFWDFGVLNVVFGIGVFIYFLKFLCLFIMVGMVFGWLLKLEISFFGIFIVFFWIFGKFNFFVKWIFFFDLFWRVFWYIFIVLFFMEEFEEFKFFFWRFVDMYGSFIRCGGDVLLGR